MTFTLLYIAQHVSDVNTQTNNNGHKRPIREHTYHRNHRHYHYAIITA